MTNYARALLKSARVKETAVSGRYFSRSRTNSGKYFTGKVP